MGRTCGEAGGHKARPYEQEPIQSAWAVSLETAGKPDNPADVRAEMSWDRLKVPLGMFAFGIACLAFALGGRLATLFGWSFGGSTSRAGEEMASAPFEHSTLSEGRPSTPASVNAYSPATGPTSRPSFGMRNR